MSCLAYQESRQCPRDNVAWPGRVTLGRFVGVGTIRDESIHNNTRVGAWFEPTRWYLDGVPAKPELVRGADITLTVFAPNPMTRQYRVRWCGTSQRHGGRGIGMALASPRSIKHN